MEKMFPREAFLDSAQKPLTQALFLELGGYSSYALYTVKDYDHEYKGKLYPSIKKIYLEISDPTEYLFVQKCFLNWRHWVRICENVMIKNHIDEWREELEIKLRCNAVNSTIAMAGQGSFQAAKWVSDRGWETRKAGRPSKEEVEKEKRVQARISSSYDEDNVRMFQQKQ
jgi:hypothetical protein